jgi:sulfur-oxidizing protein SoxY
MLLVVASLVLRSLAGMRFSPLAHGLQSLLKTTFLKGCSGDKMKYALAAFVVALAVCLPHQSIAAQQAVVDPLQSPRWEDMRKAFLADAPVPVTIDATALGKVQEVLVFADFNPIVQVLRFFPDQAPAFLGFRIKLQQSSPVRAAVRTADGVWHVGGTWVNTVGGGCTAPSATGGSKEWQKRLNEVSGRQWSEGPNAGRVRLRIVHPMDTGLIAGTPAFFLEDIDFSDAAGHHLMRVQTYEPVAENPVFTLNLGPGGSQGVVASGRDNNGNTFRARIAP